MQKGGGTANRRLWLVGSVCECLCVCVCVCVYIISYLKDYKHTLVFVTERETFEVPVRAIGPRAILDFRDELHLPDCLVKASTQKTQLVRNIGNTEAKFQLRTHR